MISLLPRTENNYLAADLFYINVIQRLIFQNKDGLQRCRSEMLAMEITKVALINAIRFGHGR